MNQKKIRKLLRDPKLFFKDMLHKRLPKKSSVAPTLVKKKGNYSYSVVAAVYGVEKYLDDFFKSLVNQSLDFKTHIQLVMVDDDSPDTSAEIIKKWQKKYPENIIYLKKDNGGQASARNLGLKYATGDWISFIDPDDFVNSDYFHALDKHITKNNGDLLFVGCNFIFYFEDKNQFSDTHPLKFRFQKESKIKISDDVNFYQLSASTAVFNSEKLSKYSVNFDENIKPSFEDGEFIARLALMAQGEYVSFLPSAKYFYRKRADGSSTLDKAAFDERRYGELLDRAHLSLLSHCDTAGKAAPIWLQNTLLYEVFWTLKLVLQHGHKFSFMTDEFKVSYLNKLRKIFSYIDDDVILRYSLAGCWFFHKVGILGFLKGTRPGFSIAYVEKWDDSRKLLCIKYFWCGDLPDESIFVGGQEIFPAYEKNRHHDFLGHEFVCERILWIHLPKSSDVLSLKLNEVPSRLSIKGKQFISGVQCDQAIDLMDKPEVDLKKINAMAKLLRSQAKNFENQKRFKKAWVFMDRDTMADDNAEHLYRYVKDYHPEVNAFFILRKNSPDWMRLEKDGFNLLGFDSEDHRIALLNADFLLSSHADSYVVDLLSRKDYGDMLRYKYIFLQHGVIKDDLSKWLNAKDMSLFLTATNAEYESIASDGTKYKFGRNTVALTGLPRHDNLIRLHDSIPRKDKKNIVVMPTWRSNLMGKNTGSGFQREFNSVFFESDYAKAWKTLLHSEALKNLSEKFDAEIIFYPHANIDIYIDGFEIPDHISVKRNGDGKSMQCVFIETDILITDYSSVAFDVAYLKKPVIYYQFDRDQIFSGDHTYERGYFDYEVDGFGPVCLKIEEVVSSLEQYLLYPDGETWAYYKNIAEKTFPFRDGKCCERTFEAVMNLQQPVVMCEDERIGRLRQGASDALQKGFVSTAINRYRQCFGLSSAEQDVKVLIALLSKDGQHGDVLKLYEAHGQQWSVATALQCLHAFASLGCDRYMQRVLDCEINFEAYLEFAQDLLKFAARNKNHQLFDDVLQKCRLPLQHSLEILQNYLHRDWEALRASMRFASTDLLVEHFDLFLQACFRTDCAAYAEQYFMEISKNFKPAIAKKYATRIQMATGDFDGALKAYEVMSKADLESLCREDIDNWLNLRQFKNVKSPISADVGISLLHRLLDDPEIASRVVQQAEFVKSGKFDEVLSIFSGCADSTPPTIALFIFKNLISQRRYDEANDFIANAAFAAFDVSDRALIADFQKMSTEILEVA